MQRLPRQHLPHLDDLNQLLAERRTQLGPKSLHSSNGAALRFVAASGKVRDYEQRVYQSGEIATRANNAHDVYNALAWLCYPSSKIALNAAHVSIATPTVAAQSSERGRRRDALTLLDESGAVVICDDPRLLTLLSQFAWKTLFWEYRAAVRKHLFCSLIGHGALQKAVTPYLGLTAKALLIAAPAGFFQQPLTQRTTLIDAAVASRLMQPAELTTPRQLQPLPLLGIPGWWPANGDPRFYDNRDYFRPPPRRR